MPGTTIILTPTSPPPAGLPIIEHVPRLTVQDSLEQLLDFLGADAQGETARQCKEAILSAYSEFITGARWSYYQGHGRLFLHPPYSTGTIAYDHTGGAYERMVTLTGGTWPDWAGSGSIRNGTVTYDIERRISDTIVTLDKQVNPGADIAAGTSYIFYQDTYTLPDDFQAQEASFYETIIGRLAYLDPAEWLAAVRRSDFTGQPVGYTLRGDPRNPGRLAVSFVPYPIETRTIDLSYQRLARRIKVMSYSTGTVSATAGVGGTATITGSGTTWTSNMVGSVIRLSPDATNLPTRLAGENPYIEERTIVTVDSTTQINVDAVITNSYSGVKYIISDPVDVELGAMQVGFQRCCEKHVAITRNLKNRDQIEKAYRDALIDARESDSRDYGNRSAGRRPIWVDAIKSPFGLRGGDIS